MKNEFRRRNEMRWTRRREREKETRMDKRMDANPH